MRTITLEEHVTTPDLARAAQMPDIGAAPGFMQAIHTKLLDIGDGRIADMDAAGIDRILFSVDYPFGSNALGRKFLDNLAVSPEDMEKLTHRNAEKLLEL